jgi:internalin A
VAGDCGGPLVFADPRLEEVVRVAIGKATGDIELVDVSELIMLEAGGRGIGDLAGVQCLPALAHAFLRANSVSDLRPLAELTGLTALWLDENDISDVGPLAGLTGLTVLSLDWNNISDVSPLVGLTSLAELHLAYNNISDLSPLAAATGLNSLVLLDVFGNPIDCAEQAANIQAVAERGVQIESECQM